MILTNPDLRVVRKGHPKYKKGLFELRTPMEYVWVSKRCIVEVPTGTMTNFASIPRGFRNVISINGGHRLPAVLHDYLYETAGKITVKAIINSDNSVTKLDTKCTIYYTRKEADQEFKRAMKQEGVTGVIRGMMYHAVRMFGGVHLKLTGGEKWKK